MLHLSAQEVKKLEGNVERAISEARKVMQDLQTSASVLEKQKHEYA